MIDITKFMIISQSNFEEIIDIFNCNLSVNDSNYLITYLFTNFIAYFFILFVIWLALYLSNLVFKRWF